MDPTRNDIKHEIDGKAKEITGEIVDDAGLVDAGRRERDSGVDPTDEVGENAGAALVGALEELAGRTVGNVDLARRGRRRRRRHAPGAA